MFLDEHINRNFDKLNDNDLHIAHFINTHIDECKNMKIQDLAQFTHASNATIHRFTRKLGFDGYSDFKSYLKFESNKTHTNYLLTLSIVSNKKSIVHSVI